MESSLNRSFHFFFLSLALLWCLSFADLIDDVCSETNDPSFCSKSLKSDPGSRGADLKSLGRIAIKLSTENVQTANQLLPKLKKEATGRLIEVYKTCLETYGDGAVNLADALNYLNNGDFLGMNAKASAGQDDIVTCDNGFEDAGESQPENLYQAGQCT